ncbi:MAG TPA: MFS transporter [Streptosporangiaceae bacterium]|nr:MFS transporter [Streptosporangiaceae bacterium]
MTEGTDIHREIGEAGRSRRPAALPVGQYHWRMALPQTAGFWLVAGVLVLSLFAATAPSPLYRVYQDQLRFSALTLTAVFAVYSVAVLVTLLVFGSVSDYVGRRPVIVAALAFNMGGCALFLAAHTVGLLVAARVLQGVAVGAGIGALGAAMIDLQPGGSSLASVATSAGNFLGQSTGALCASLLAQYGPAPTHLIWWLLLGGLAAAAAGILVMAESGTRRPGVLASLRPRVGVPRQARVAFVVATPCLIAAWGLCGFYLSLGPLLAVQVIGSPNLAWGGLVIFLLTGVAAAAAVAGAGIPAGGAMLLGCLILFGGVAITFGAIATGTAAAFLAGTAVAGVGFGLAFLGAFEMVTALAPPAERAGLVAAIFIVNFLAFSIPAVIAGWAVTRYGLHRTALVYCAVVAALVAAAAGSLMLRSDARRTSTTVHSGQ